jgi:hypothetical protein
LRTGGATFVVAPGIVQGGIQVNLQIPATAPSGIRTDH